MTDAEMVGWALLVLLFAYNGFLLVLSERRLARLQRLLDKAPPDVTVKKVVATEYDCYHPIEDMAISYSDVPCHNCARCGMWLKGTAP